MAYSKQKGDIAYYKPLCVCKKGTKLVGHKNIYEQWYDIHTKTKPIAYSTKATYDWLGILHKESSNWEEMLNKANGISGEYLNDPEATQVIQAYIKCKAPFNSMTFI